MAQLFVCASAAVAPWCAHPLEAPRYALVAGPDGALAARPGGGDDDVVLLRSAAPTPERAAATEAHEVWVLLAAPGASVWLNGAPLAAGLAVLRDRDEVRVGRLGRVFFSSERLATTEPFDGPEPMQCPRCWLPMEPSQITACCVTCGVRMHAAPTKPCFEHEGPCPGCAEPTRLGAELRWNPGLCGY